MTTDNPLPTVQRMFQAFANHESEAKRLIEFLGLPGDDKCLVFHKSDRPVKTASVAQVRKPIYKDGVEHWPPQSKNEVASALITRIARAMSGRP